MGSGAESSVFSFFEVSFNEVREVINNLKNKNCRDAFGLNVRIIKSVKNLENSDALDKTYKHVHKKLCFPRKFEKGNSFSSV